MKLRVLLSLKLVPFIVLSSAEICDRARTARVWEGNLGQSAHFNWLGVLIVHLREWDEGRTAMTGIVLIKFKYALANADDVVRIPQSIFKKNSRAMFLPARNTTWFAELSSYVTHPEYQHTTLNSIAIIQLNLDKVNNYQLTPICLPNAHTSHASRYLYLTGITDDNRKFEKIIYKIQYLHKKSCEEFHNNKRARLPSQELTTFLCGYAPNIVTQCLWENGMALVSNATGVFNLIGLAIQGPGCAAPARFMELFRYLSWIHAVTRPDQTYYEGEFRRKIGGNKFVPNVPIHELFAAEDARRTNVYKHDYEAYPFDVESLKFHIVKPTKDNNTIVITPLDDKWERYPNACVLPKEVIYAEYFEVRALDELRGSITYKLSLYDIRHKKCVCVRLTIINKSRNRTSGILSFREEVVNFKENIELREQSGETPEELFREFPKKRQIYKKHKGNWKMDDDFFKPDFLNDDNLFYSGNIVNCDLYIKFEFDERAIMQFEMLAESELLNKPTTDSVTAGCPTTLDPGTTDGDTTTAAPQKTHPPVYRRRGHVQRKGKKKSRPTSLWGIDNWGDFMVRETELRPVVDVEEPREIQETRSASCSEAAPGAVVMSCWLISSYLRRVFFVH